MRSREQIWNGFARLLCTPVDAKPHGAQIWGKMPFGVKLHTTNCTINPLKVLNCSAGFETFGIYFGFKDVSLWGGSGVKTEIDLVTHRLPIRQPFLAQSTHPTFLLSRKNSKPLQDQQPTMADPEPSITAALAADAPTTKQTVDPTMFLERLAKMVLRKQSTT